MTGSHAVVEHDIDPSEALRALGYRETTRLEPITGGWETLMWRFKTPDGGRHSLRVYWLPHLDTVYEREWMALRAAADAGLPTPHIESTGKVAGRPAAVLSWRPGRPVLSHMEKRPWRIWALSKAMGLMQARLHAVKPPSGLREGTPESWLALAGEEYADIIEHARASNITTDSFIHMDYHPLNVLSDGRTITGVVDFARATAGDPRADLARTEITQLWAPIPPGPTKPIFEMLRKVMLRAWRSGYKEEAGALPDYQRLLAWAGATMLKEVEPVLGQPGVWGTEEDLDRLRAMIETWAREAGIR